VKEKRPLRDSCEPLQFCAKINGTEINPTLLHDGLSSRAQLRCNGSLSPFR
jgi:hypothetical protein